MTDKPKAETIVINDLSTESAVRNVLTDFYLSIKGQECYQYKSIEYIDKQGYMLALSNPYVSDERPVKIITASFSSPSIQPYVRHYANSAIETKSAQVEFIPYSLKHLNEMLDVFFKDEHSLYAIQSPRYDLRFEGKEGNVGLTHWDYAAKTDLAE